MNKYTVRKVHPRKGFFVVEVEELKHIDQIEPIIGQEIFADPDQIAKLDDGDFYWYELVGLQVETTAGRYLGKVISIIPTGANDVLQVIDGEREYLIPYIDNVVVEINLDSEKLLIDPPQGLLD